MKWEANVELRLRWMLYASILLLAASHIYGLGCDALTRFASTYAATLTFFTAAPALLVGLAGVVKGTVERVGGGGLDLNALISEAARNVGLRWTPEIALLKAKVGNACATLIPYRVTVTTAALEALTPDELEAVLEHECAHLKLLHNLKVFAAAALIATLLAWLLPPSLAGPASLVAIVLIVRPILKRFEREADSNVKSWNELASALLKLKSYSEALSGRRFKLLGRLSRLLMPHPPVEERVRRLRRA